MPVEARAFWTCGPGRGEVRTTAVREPEAGEVMVRTLHTGISRGTEALVFNGRVPASHRVEMRAPFQEGDLPGPVKYGYLNVGAVVQGPEALLGQTVFCLYPHQSAYVVDASCVTVVPDGVPASRAVLVGTIETAINAVWDAGVLVGDRVTVVGAGMVGCCVAWLVGRIPGTEVTLVDIDPSRAAVAEALGVDFRLPHEADGDRDLVVHASATSAGLQRSLDLLAREGTVVDLSWYGDEPTTLALGGSFHTRRLTIRASQVGTVSPAAQGRRTASERLALAARLLADPALDALLTDRSDFDDLPRTMAQIAAGERRSICHVVDYSEV